MIILEDQGWAKLRETQAKFDAQWNAVWDRFEEEGHIDMSKLPKVTEEELIARSQFPRVTFQEMQDNIIKETFYQQDLLTICVLTLKNGFTVLGSSACAVPGNFKKDVGERLARANAENKIWELMGYELKTKVALVLGSEIPPSLPDQKTYVGQKVVHAKPMSRLAYNMVRGWDLPRNEDGADEGYLVEYADSAGQVPYFHGYLSWSPKDVFERAYELVDVHGEGSKVPASEQETWESRIFQEKEELEARLVKLREFMQGPLYQALPERDCSLLVQQREAMSSYLNILVSRLVGNS